MFEGSQDKHPVILIVDDEVTNIKVLHEAVRDLGDVIFANDGPSAIARARAARPDLVLLDIEMPGMNGYEVCQALKAIPETAGCCVIFVTAQEGAVHELQSLNSGGSDFLQKPLNIPIARARVKTQLELRSHAVSLANARRDLDEVVHHLPAFIAYWGADELNRFSNDIEGRWFGLTPEQMKMKSLQTVVGEAIYHQLAPCRYDSAGPDGHVLELDLGVTPGGMRFAQASLVFDCTEIDASRGFLLLLTDITPRKLAELALLEEKERIRITLNSIGDAVISTDNTGMVTFLNPIAEEMTGWRARDAVGLPIEIVMPLTDGSSGAKVMNPARLALKERRIVGMGMNFNLVARNGGECSIEDSAAPILDPAGEVCGAIIVFHDVSEARAMAIKMTHLAHHDALTDLPNRMLLLDRIDQALHQARSNDSRVALMILDLDQFKFINDAIGHATGDEVLQQLARRMKAILRTTDTISRHGGDEFILLLPNLDSVEMASAVVASLLHICQEPFIVYDNSFSISFCIGISVFPDDANDRESLLRHADSAMYRAKQFGRGHVQFFSSDIEELLLARHLLERHLREALDQELLEVFYQPKIDIGVNEIVGVEALIRLRNDSGELVSPAYFIPLAEESGLIVPLGKFVLLEACRQARHWYASGHPIKVSVNISAVQFIESGFPTLVAATLRETGLDPALLELEITEGVLMYDVEKARATLCALKALGVKISIDDFGTGYSSLAYLKRFPMDVLKIDQSFVRDMLTDSSDAAIISAIVNLGTSLGMELVAEGVEQVEQAEALFNLGCRIMQGYLYSRPIPAADMTAMLAKALPPVASGR